uniref:Uncharacterized protein n=1 Tax=Chromera velia CCMP2878 TaxID=1169474 RepID=A0A0G4I7E8_9ALVE|eukprot:Cvel_11588.t1-p1 / transcript=Cvel_11588.t1 / gene=Cvel_11588 / organism=Chromera_velia_CCMP2878 / gene_product=hypothetical protein / transcript_product=hypothetical protein / location=Cvel_scaffold733:19346-25844(-) / protein_length=1232 / sequence_SO=supercontig / SO=protein_coding / is_pseudo=false
MSAVTAQLFDAPRGKLWLGAEGAPRKLRFLLEDEHRCTDPIFLSEQGRLVFFKKEARSQIKLDKAVEVFSTFISQLKPDLPQWKETCGWEFFGKVIGGDHTPIDFVAIPTADGNYGYLLREDVRSYYGTEWDRIKAELVDEKKKRMTSITPQNLKNAERNVEARLFCQVVLWVMGACGLLKATLVKNVDPPMIQWASDLAKEKKNLPKDSPFEWLKKTVFEERRVQIERVRQTSKSKGADSHKETASTATSSKPPDNQKNEGGWGRPLKEKSQEASSSSSSSALGKEQGGSFSTLESKQTPLLATPEKPEERGASLKSMSNALTETSKPLNPLLGILKGGGGGNSADDQARGATLEEINVWGRNSSDRQPAQSPSGSPIVKTSPFPVDQGGIWRDSGGGDGWGPPEKKGALLTALDDGPPPGFDGPPPGFEDVGPSKAKADMEDGSFESGRFMPPPGMDDGECLGGLEEDGSLEPATGGLGAPNADAAGGGGSLWQLPADDDVTGSDVTRGLWGGLSSGGGLWGDSEGGIGGLSLRGEDFVDVEGKSNLSGSASLETGTGHTANLHAILSGVSFENLGRGARQGTDGALGGGLSLMQREPKAPGGDVDDATSDTGDSDTAGTPVNDADRNRQIMRPMKEGAYPLPCEENKIRWILKQDANDEQLKKTRVIYCLQQQVFPFDDLPVSVQQHLERLRKEVRQCLEAVRVLKQREAVPHSWLTQAELLEQLPVKLLFYVRLREELHRLKMRENRKTSKMFGGWTMSQLENLSLSQGLALFPREFFALDCEDSETTALSSQPGGHLLPTPPPGNKLLQGSSAVSDSGKPSTGKGLLSSSASSERGAPSASVPRGAGQSSSSSSSGISRPSPSPERPSGPGRFHIAPPPNFESLHPDHHVVLVDPTREEHLEKVYDYIKFRLECQIRQMLITAPPGTTAVPVARVAELMTQQRDVREILANIPHPHAKKVSALLVKFADVFEVNSDIKAVRLRIPGKPPKEPEGIYRYRMGAPRAREPNSLSSSTSSTGGGMASAAPSGSTTTFPPKPPPPPRPPATIPGRPAVPPPPPQPAPPLTAAAGFRPPGPPNVMKPPAAAAGAASTSLNPNASEFVPSFGPSPTSQDRTSTGFFQRSNGTPPEGGSLAASSASSGEGGMLLGGVEDGEDSKDSLNEALNAIELVLNSVPAKEMSISTLGQDTKVRGAFSHLSNKWSVKKVIQTAPHLFKIEGALVRINVSP